MKITPTAQYVNYLAIDLLEILGNKQPDQQQIDLMENLISHVAVTHRISFDRRLTGREISCLYLSAKGKTAPETARLLGVKPSTITSHRKEILRKLACNNMAAAVFKGMQCGYLQQKPMEEQEREP